MDKANYKQVYQKFTKGISPKTKDIFDRRFGVKSGELETLEAIGKTLGITRERVRQIEEAGFNFVKKNNKEALDGIFVQFANYFKNQGGFKKEEKVLEELGGRNQKPYVLFLLTLGEQFSKVCEKKDYNYFWSNLPNAQETVKGTLNSLVSQMKKIGKPISQKDFYAQVASTQGLSEVAALSYLEISKKFLNICKDYSPYVEMFSIDELFMDITKTLHLFGGAYGIIKTITTFSATGVYL